MFYIFYREQVLVAELDKVFEDEILAVNDLVCINHFLVKSNIKKWGPYIFHRAEAIAATHSSIGILFLNMVRCE